jgi:hypothetical protein
MLKLNLQLFSADEDAILPDDFEETFESDLPADNETPEIDTTESEETPAAEGEETLSEQDQQLFNVKYNKEEKQLTLEEMTKYAQMGMNYDKVQGQLQELQNDPGRTFLQDLAKNNGFDNVNDFINDFKAAQEQSRIDELIQQNIPEEYAKKMIEMEKFQQQFEQQQQQKEQEQREIEEFKGLNEVFREFNDRDFNPDTDRIPDEVFQVAQENGVPLKFAYESFMAKQLKQQQQIYKQNEQNFKRNVGTSTTQHGSVQTEAEDDFLAGFDSYKY